MGRNRSLAMRVVGIDHLVIRVSDVEQSKAFYKNVLGALGFKLKYDYGDTFGWSNGKTLFWIGQADAQGKKNKHHTGDIGFHHYAFELSKRKDVDDFHKALEKYGVEVIDPPDDYYEGGYYAVYFLDPDGLKFEAMVFDPNGLRKAKQKARQQAQAKRPKGRRKRR
jgi:catechol 2,3-dioxygenase-like lactoylglutathione lyase family enzyme